MDFDLNSESLQILEDGLGSLAHGIKKLKLFVSKLRQSKGQASKASLITVPPKSPVSTFKLELISAEEFLGKVTFTPSGFSDRFFKEMLGTCVARADRYKNYWIYRGGKWRATTETFIREKIFYPLNGRLYDIQEIMGKLTEENLEQLIPKAADYNTRERQIFFDLTYKFGLDYKLTWKDLKLCLVDIHRLLPRL